MQSREGTPSLTRRSKKDDVEALLSDFDILDDTGKSISAPPQDGTAVAGGAAADAAQRLHHEVAGSAPRAERSTSIASRSGATLSTAKASQPDEASSLLADLDDLVKQRRSTTPKHRLSQPMTPATVSYTRTARGPTSGAQTPVEPASGEASLAASGSLPSVPASSSRQGFERAQSPPTAGASSQAAPSWGGWWSSATKLADQARAELEKRAGQVQAQVTERAKEAAAAAQQVSTARVSEDGMGSSEAGPASVKPWMLASNVNSFLKSHAGDLDKLRSDLGKVGMRGWNEILHVVAPPIESHEVLSITLSHDMTGFDGVPDVVFQVLQRVMETHASSQDAEHQLVVNSAPTQADGRTSIDQSHKPEALQTGPDMNPVEGFETAWKLAESKLQELINEHQISDAKPSNDTQGSVQEEGATLPITKCPLFIRIQPVVATLPGTQLSSPDKYIFIAILLRDTANNLTHRTVSQPILQRYATLSFEDEPWAEDLLSESLQAALSSVGIEYIRTRMQARKEALAKAAEAVGDTTIVPEPVTST